MNKSGKQLRTWLSGLLVFALLATIQGCGFRIRGGLDQPLNIPAAMQVTYIQTDNPLGDLNRELRKVLTQFGVTVTKQRSEATGVLSIIDERFRRRVLSVDGNSREQEFELFMEVTFKLLSADGLDIVGEQSLKVDRNYLFDSNDPLGKGNEERIIRQEMVRNLVLRMLRVIRAKTSAAG